MENVRLEAFEMPGAPRRLVAFGHDEYDVVDRRKTAQSAAVLDVLIRHLADWPERPGRRWTPQPQ